MNPSTPKAHKSHRVLYCLITLFLMADSAAGVYFWQQQKIKDFDKKITTLNSQVSNLDSQVTKLEATFPAQPATSN